jgi:hypothetical protein
MRAPSVTLLALWLLNVMVSPSGAQTLGEVAQKEAERRKAIAGEAKVYTNKDLRPVPAVEPRPGGATGTPSAGSPDAAKADGLRAGEAGKDTAAAGADASSADAKGEAYWRGRLKDLETTLARQETYVDALQSRINALTTDFVNRDDPAQRAVIEADRKKALDELDRLKKDVEANRKAIADLQDEARRARVPPGWLR